MKLCALNSSVLVLVFGIAVVNGYVVKLSKNIIRDGDTVYKFFTAANDHLIRYQDTTIPDRHVLAMKEIPWTAITYTVEAELDVNIMPDGTYNMYFTAFNSQTFRKAIGVATASQIGTTDYSFTSSWTPLLGDEYGDVSNPTVVQESGVLYLYFYNSTHGSDGHGDVLRATLSDDGLSVLSITLG